LKIGKNVKEQLASDLELELGAVKMYNASIKVARDEGDNASAEFLRGYWSMKKSTWIGWKRNCT